MIFISDDTSWISEAHTNYSGNGHDLAVVFNGQADILNEEDPEAHDRNTNSWAGGDTEHIPVESQAEAFDTECFYAWNQTCFAIDIWRRRWIFAFFDLEAHQAETK